LKEGSALKDFFYPDRIVVGTESQDAENLLYDLYKPFLAQNDHFIVMNIASAELTKYASNAMLATRISFMNQLALLADKAGADIAEIKRGMSYDKRIGGAFLDAGVGYGGSCFPKDVKGLVHTGHEYNTPMSLIKEVDAINDQQRASFISLILDQYPTVTGKTFGIWGLAFKPETDDIRCAPSIDVITTLLEKGAHIVAYDPEAMNNIKALFGNKITYCNDAFSVIQASDSLVILTEWEEFLSTRPVDFLLLKDKNIFDGRNCFQGEALAKIGLHYFCIGRMIKTHDTCATESFWLHNSSQDALF
jgi:UDPglucose 6-dehydrogenase